MTPREAPRRDVAAPRVAVLGSGSWGTTFGKVLADGGADVMMWARRAELAHEIREGKFAEARDEWLKSLDFDDVEGTGLRWAREGNAYVCSHGKS